MGTEKGIDRDDEATWVQLRDRLRELREWSDQLDNVDRAGLLAILNRPREVAP